MVKFEDHCWQDIVSQEIVDIYQKYQRETYIGPKPALLSIDIYNRVFEGGSRPVHELVQEYPSTCGMYAWEALPAITQLHDLVRSKGIPIIYTRGESRGQAVVATTMRQKDGLQIDNDPDGYQIREEIKPQPGDLIIYKERASAFFGTPLIAHLRRLGVESLIVCGESTSGCVRASVVDAFNYGFHVALVEECCFDRSLLSHKVNLFDMHHKYADVVRLEEVQSHFRSISG